jgi:hypothetical protein
MIIGLLVAYVLIDSLFVGIPGFQRGLFGLILLGTMLAAVATVGRVRIGSRELTYLLAAFAVLVGGTVGILTQSILYPFYILGDMASIGLLGLFVVFGLATPKALFSGKAITVLWGACLVGSLLSPLIGVENGRYDPPSPFLIGATVGFAIATPRRSSAFGAVVLLCVLVLLAYQSGFRTHVVLAVVGVFVAFGRLVGPRFWLFGLAVLVAAVVINAPSIGTYVARQAVISNSRFQGLSTGEADQSVFERSLEVRDAWTSARDGWSKPQWIVGAGHGATYVPVESYIVRNIMRENRVHNIHVGPMLVLYRYGFLGVTVLFLLVIVTVRHSWSLFFGRHRPIHAGDVFPWIILFYLADFMVRNVMIDPFFAYALAGMAAGHRRSAQVALKNDKYEIDRQSGHVAAGSI